MQYAFKPSYRGASPLMLATLERTDRLWQKHGGPPRYVVLCDEEAGPEPGNIVYEWRGASSYWADTDHIPGHKVAFLKEKGKKGRKIVWESSPNMYHVFYGKMIEDTFFVEGTKHFYNSEPAQSFMALCRTGYGHVRLEISNRTF